MSAMAKICSTLMAYKARTVWCVLFLFCLAFVSLAADTSRLSQEDDIREAVFRHQFEHNASGQQKSAHDYFLAIGEKNADPSDEFMKRFAHNKPPVRKASACRGDSSGWIVNKRTGKHGLLFRVASITWISDTEVKVWGGYDEANLSSSGNTYTVNKENGQWKVTNDHIDVISNILPQCLPTTATKSSSQMALYRRNAH
jgi:hypothetical protein